VRKSVFALMLAIDRAGIMKFHALLSVRDEADIVGQYLAHVLQFAQAIYLLREVCVDI
jgi:hypothetical protein